MDATREAKEAWLAQPCEIEAELRQLFGAEEEFWICDVGACDGLSSIRYARMFPRSKILAIEARRDNCDEMRRNFDSYLNGRTAVIVEAALSDRPCQVSMWLSSGDAPGVKDWNTGNKSSSILRPTGHLQAHPWCTFENRVTMSARRLDTVVSEYGCDFMHIDVQGAEILVLKGATETLKSCRAVWCEVENVEMYSRQPLKRDVVSFMGWAGFKVKKDCCGSRASGDVLFVQR